MVCGFRVYTYMFINTHTHPVVCQTSSTIVVARTPLGLLSCLNKKNYKKKSAEDQPHCPGLWHSSNPNARSLSHSPSPPPPSFTQSPSPPRSLMRDGQTSPHRPRLVVSRSTSSTPSPHANSFIIGTAVMSTHTGCQWVGSDPRARWSLCLTKVKKGVEARAAVPGSLAGPPKPSRWNDQRPRSWPLGLGAASSPRRARSQSAAEPDAPPFLFPIDKGS